LLYGAKGDEYRIRMTLCLDARIETDTHGVLADHELLEGVIQVALTEPLLQHLKVWLAPSLQQLLH